MSDMEELNKIFLDSNNIKVIRACLSEGVDVNLKDKSGNTKLWKACNGNKIDLVKFLITIPGIDVNTKGGDYGRSAIASPTDIEIVKLLKEAGADINSTDRDGNTVLMSNTGFPDILKYLVACGADLSIKNKQGETIHDLVKEKLWLKNTYELAECAINNLNTDEFDRLFKDKIKDLSSEKKKEYIKYLLNNTD